MLNGETFELLQCSKLVREGRVFDWVRIEKAEGCTFRLVIMHKEKEIGKLTVKEVESFDAIANCLRMVLKCAALEGLELDEVPLTDGFLLSILSWLVDTGCRLQKLWITRTSMAHVTSSVLLRFLRGAAPSGTAFCAIFDCSRDNFSPEVLHFVVTRQFVVMGSFCGGFIPIYDDILNKLTATNFFIDVPNMITINGLKSFVERLSKGKQKVRYGRINTNFSLDGMSFSIAPNANLRLVLGKDYIIFSSEEVDTESLGLLDVSTEPPLFLLPLGHLSL